jgi:hypothetical protein
LSDPTTAWERITLDWYGQGHRTLELCTGTTCWYRFGSTPLSIRWVLTRDPAGKRPPKALFSTDQAQSAQEIVRDFMKRWSLEVTFEESRAHLGIETQRQWSDLAIERTTPLLLSALQSRHALWLGPGFRWTSFFPASRVVSQASSDVPRRPGTGTSASLGQFYFSHIPVEPQRRFITSVDASTVSSCGLLLTTNVQSRAEYYSAT